jgi:nucleotide-binding universal stress UspA family protein
MSATNEGDGESISPREHPLGEPLSPLESRMTEQTALERAASSTEPALGPQRGLRAEVESRRVSEEVTRQAQERLRAAREETADVEIVKPSMLSLPELERTLPAASAFHRILVPLDGTPAAEEALPYVTSLGRMLSAHVTLAHIYLSGGPRLISRLTERGGREMTMDEVAQSALPYLHGIREAMAAQVKGVGAQVLIAPSVEDGLNELQTTSDVDLVAVAMRAHGGEHFTLGHTIDGLLRRGRAPVLVVPPQETPQREPRFKHILVPLDGSEVAELALGPLQGVCAGRAWPDGQTQQVTLLSVAENHITRRHAEDYLAAIRAHLMAAPEMRGIRIRTVAKVGLAQDAVVAAAGGRQPEAADPERPVDLLVMATHGRGGFGRWIYGSVAAYVLPRVRVPVLLAHPVPEP